MSKKTIIGFGAGAIMFLTSTLSVLAASPANFGGNTNAFTNDYNSHYINNYNGELRFDWANQRIAVPGEAYLNVNSNSAVVDNGGYSLVDPLNTL